MNIRAVELHSKKLGATVWLAMDRQAARELWIRGIREAIYLPEDIEAMRGIPDAALPIINAAKIAFPGSPIEPWEPIAKETPPAAEQRLGLGLH